MSTDSIIELAAAVAIFVAGILLYRRRSASDGQYGSQGAVLLFVIAVILAIHALGGLDYRPSQGELDSARTQ